MQVYTHGKAAAVDIHDDKPVARNAILGQVIIAAKQRGAGASADEFLPGMSHTPNARRINMGIAQNVFVPAQACADARVFVDHRNESGGRSVRHAVYGPDRAMRSNKSVRDAASFGGGDVGVQPANLTGRQTGSGATLVVEEGEMGVAVVKRVGAVLTVP